MYNRTPYNRTPYNRSEVFAFEWLSTVYADAATTASLLIIRRFAASVEAVASASGNFIRVLFFDSGAEATTEAIGVYIRTLFFASEVDAIAYASGTGVSNYGSVTLVIDGVNMSAGDELVIDTEHMTVTLNGANIVDRITDASAFFKLMSGENEIIVEGGTTADIRVLWKDRWL